MTAMKPYDEMTLEERRARYQTRKALFEGKCAKCGFYGLNVIHDPLRYREDDPYHLDNPDVPYCIFRPAFEPRVVESR